MLRTFVFVVIAFMFVCVVGTRKVLLMQIKQRKEKIKRNFSIVCNQVNMLPQQSLDIACLSREFYLKKCAAFCC